MKNSGCIASGYDPRDIELESKSSNLPYEFTYGSYIKRVKDQGASFKCVPYAISYALELIAEWNDKKVNVDIDKIYGMRSNSSDGMMIREALNIIKHNDCGADKISLYGRLTSIDTIKYSVVANGPCIMALPVRSDGDQFWRGHEDMGAHAICCIGYNSTGFILVNSWGAKWGNYGQCVLPYKEANRIIECWGIIC